ncbi:hypothetical protein [Actinomadura sp. WMMA1423]|uniref:hypothetical protein n=1 Tax=Actinomadura sp. WMMA1423 TaxID=2591108 RepID=UPI001146D448|nr:hypothetical protein [Actinomadura sp. WMMA1423]
MKRILRTMAVTGITMGAAVLAAPSAMADINFYAVEKAYVGHNGPTYVSEKGPGDLMYTDIVKSPHAAPVIGNKPVKTGDITTKLHGGKHNTAVAGVEGAEQAEATKVSLAKAEEQQAAPKQQAAPQQTAQQQEAAPQAEAAPQQESLQAAPEQDAQQAAPEQGNELAAPEQDAQQNAQQQDAQQNAQQQQGEAAAPQQDAQQAAPEQGNELAAPEQDAQQNAQQQDAQQNAQQQDAQQGAPEQGYQQAASQGGYHHQAAPQGGYYQQAAPQQEAQQNAPQQQDAMSAPQMGQRAAAEKPRPKHGSVDIHAVKQAAVGQNGDVGVAENGSGDAVFTNLTKSPHSLVLAGNSATMVDDINSHIHGGEHNTVINAVAGPEQESSK